MINVTAFKALIPNKNQVERIVCYPYDVLSDDECRKLAEDPINFVHVIRAEVDFDKSKNRYSKEIYEKSTENLKKMIHDGTLKFDEQKAYYIYEQDSIHGIRKGIVALNDIKDYNDKKIRRHELTLTEKENDRIEHFIACDAHTEPVFLFYEKNENLTSAVERLTNTLKPEYDFTTMDKVRHKLYKVTNTEDINKITEYFRSTEMLFIADGHHRSAAAVKAGIIKRKADKNPAKEYEKYMSVIFPSESLKIMPYNRIVKNLNGYEIDEFLELVSKNFEITKSNNLDEPTNKGIFKLIINTGKYNFEKNDIDALDIYTLRFKSTIADPVSNLDVSILQNNILDPILAIKDPRTNPDIEFYGGEHMLSDILKRLSEGMKAAFLLYPTQTEEIIKVSKLDKIMPPKSTWFDPKLISGLFINMM